ncbi:hypothetical protein HZH66_014141 [Vespula vulgaris]|uniref:Uncharacterized protein n=1 Tax=Vespula vulgaris TaxID=7454 RepID=A0A834MQ93_VESVU|nr:hypothetical protein HZH66_014141 [Vespula vulgaris]
MCDDNVCDGGLETKICQDEDYTFDEFITNLQHKKCKVIQLVRRQIHEFRDMQIFPIVNNTQEKMFRYRMEDQSFREDQTEKMPVSLFHTISKTLISSQTWMEYIYSRLSSRFVLATLFIDIFILNVQYFEHIECFCQFRINIAAYL